MSTCCTGCVVCEVDGMPVEASLLPWLNGKSMGRPVRYPSAAALPPAKRTRRERGLSRVVTMQAPMVGHHEVGSLAVAEPGQRSRSGIGIRIAERERKPVGTRRPLTHTARQAGTPGGGGMA